MTTNATTIRLPEPLHGEANAYADALGISLNALIAVALHEYMNRPRCNVIPLEEARAHWRAECKWPPGSFRE